jgi:hypothetical protein
VIETEIIVPQRLGEERLIFAPPSFLIGLMVLIWVGPSSPAVTTRKSDAVTLRGKVLMLSDVLKSSGIAIKADLEPIAKQAVLLGEDGTITPLLSDEASRALFLDDRLRGRPAEIRGRRYDGVPYLQVMNFRVEREGRLEMPEYFCEICAISVRFPQICPCCQGPMELRMRPDRR